MNGAPNGVIDAASANISVADALRQILRDGMAATWLFTGIGRHDGFVASFTEARAESIGALATGAATIAKHLSPEMDFSPLPRHPPALNPPTAISDKRRLVAEGVLEGRWSTWSLAAIDGNGAHLPLLIQVLPDRADERALLGERMAHAAVLLGEAAKAPSLQAALDFQDRGRDAGSER